MRAEAIEHGTLYVHRAYPVVPSRSPAPLVLMELAEHSLGRPSSDGNPPAHLVRWIRCGHYSFLREVPSVDFIRPATDQEVEAFWRLDATTRAQIQEHEQDEAARERQRLEAEQRREALARIVSVLEGAGIPSLIEDDGVTPIHVRLDADALDPLEAALAPHLSR